MPEPSIEKVYLFHSRCNDSCIYSLLSQLHPHAYTKQHTTPTPIHMVPTQTQPLSAIASPAMRNGEISYEVQKSEVDSASAFRHIFVSQTTK